MTGFHHGHRRTMRLALLLAGAAGAGSAGAQTPAADAATQEIVVTGSRIARGGFTAPTPVTTVGAERVNELAATNIADVLNQLPAFRASTSPSATQTTPGNALGSRILELRGLGPARTLLLVNGKRHVPTTAQGTVDVNFIPTILVARADVVTGGASAAYGSDAVAGVVNLILDTRLNGLRGEVQTGVSQQGDDQNYRVALAGGTAFAEDRGHIVLAGEYEDNKGIGDCYSARTICAQEWSLLGNTPAGRLGLPALNVLPDIHTASLAPGGLITSAGPLRGLTFGADGQPVVYQPGLLPGLYQQGGSGHGENAFLTGLLLKVPVERYSLYGNGSYEFSDALKATLELSHGRVEAFAPSAQLRDTGALIGPIRRDNPYLPASIVATMAANNIASFTMGRSGLDIGNALSRSQSTTWRGVAGLEGAIAGSWKWDAYYQYGRSEYRQQASNNIIRSRLLLAVDAVRAPDGTIVCRSALAAPGNGCVPLNLIGPNRYTAEAKAYITGTSTLALDITQQVAAANVQGDLFELPGGPVTVALGAEYRRDKVSGTVDPISQAGGFYVSNFAASNGRVTVKEGYAEVVAPLLKDVAFANTLELNGAARRTDYSTSGAVTTWKGGAVWEPVRQIRLRATRSRDIRAPNAAELFGSVTRSFSSFTDPQTSRQDLIEVVSGANSALLAEKADTFTAGAVLRPDFAFARGLNISVDYYRVKVADAIGAIGSQTIALRCAGGATEFCPLITRNAAGTVTAINDRLQNVNALRTSGLDIEVQYRTALGPRTSADVRVLATKTFHLTTQDSAGAVDRAGQTGFRASTVPGVPDWIVDGIVNLRHGPVTLTTHGRYIPRGKFNVDYVGPEDAGYSPTLVNSINTNRVGGRFYADMTVTVAVKQGRTDVELFGAVTNLFDRDPPIAPSAVGITNQVLFDQIGRAFRAGVRFRR